MGLIDRDYWREKHNPNWNRREEKNVDLARLQRGVDVEIRRAKRASDGVAPILWRVIAWIAAAVVLFAILRALGAGRH